MHVQRIFIGYVLSLTKQPVILQNFFTFPHCITHKYWPYKNTSEFFSRKLQNDAMIWLVNLWWRLKASQSYVVTRFFISDMYSVRRWFLFRLWWEASFYWASNTNDSAKLHWCVQLQGSTCTSGGEVLLGTVKTKNLRFNMPHGWCFFVPRNHLRIEESMKIR